MIVSDFKDNLSAMLHGGTLNKVRNIEAAFERAANTMLTKIDPIDTMRTVALNNTVHDDVYNYSLATDYKKIIDLRPQSGRNSHDTAVRNTTERFDLRRKFRDKTVSIEGSEGTKIIRINWPSRRAKVLNEADTITANGTWAVVATATNLVADSIDYVSGSGSLRFDVAATGDGIDNSTMSALDLTEEDEVGDVFMWFKIQTAANLANLTSVTGIWGSSVTTNFWTGVAQTTQADGTAFKVGWNRIKIPWSTATEDGTAVPAAINFFRVTFTVAAAITNIQIDNVIVSIGRNFDMAYYSKYLLKNSSGVWISKTTDDSDVIVIDNDAIQIYLLEALIACAHQMEGADSGFDINWAKGELIDLYRRYKAEYPSMSKKAMAYYGSSTSKRHFNRGYNR